MSLFGWVKGAKKNGVISTCPYCCTNLDKVPGRKSKCPHCRKEIYVRTTQKIFDSNLLTKDQALAVDAIRENEHNGLLADEFFKLISSRPHDKPTDVLWGYFQQKNLEIMKKGDWHALKMLNYSMALFLNKEGRDHRHCLEAAAKYELENYRKEGFVEKVRIIVAKDSCDICKKNSQMVITLKEAIQDLPVPCRDCTHIIHNEKFGFCRCIYISEIDFGKA